MQDIDNILLNALDGQKIQAPTDAWPFIAHALHKRKRRRIAWFFLAFLMLLIVSTGSLLLYNFKTDRKKDVANNVAIAKSYSIISKNEKNKKENIASDRILQNISDTIFKDDQNKIVKKAILSSTIKDNELFEKTAIKKKIKSRTNLKIISSQALEETQMEGAKLPSQQSVINAGEKIIEITKANDKPVDFEHLENAKIFIVTTDINKEDLIKENRIENSKEKLPASKNEKSKKWNSYVGLSYGALFIGSKNFFKTGDNRFDANAYSFGNGNNQGAINNIYPANYQTGKNISFSIILKKEQTKIQPQFGVNLNIGNFNVKAYNATNAFLASSTFVVDSSQIGNSNYGARSTIAGNQIKVKNNFLQIGLVAGCSIPIYSFRQGQKISVQVQVLPTYNIAQSIQWYDKTSTRYFTSKSLNNDFNITQSTALLWQTNIKKRKMLIGPYFNFNYFKLNKNVNNIANIYTQIFGAQFQVQLKK